MSDITESVAISNEIVISERVVSTEFKVIEMHESVPQRRVTADVELGPFTDEVLPSGQTISRGISRRNVTVWQDAEYDAVRDTWNNLDLLTKVTTILNG